MHHLRLLQQCGSTEAGFDTILGTGDVRLAATALFRLLSFLIWTFHRQVCKLHQGEKFWLQCWQLSGTRTGARLWAAILSLH